MDSIYKMKSIRNLVILITSLMVVFSFIGLAIVSAQVKIGETPTTISGVVIKPPTKFLTGNLTNFTSLNDTPVSYSGSTGLCAVVNSGETGLEFTSCAAAGDTNETVRFEELVAADCAAGTLVIGIQNNGTVLCAADADSGATNQFNQILNTTSNVTFYRINATDWGNVSNQFHYNQTDTIFFYNQTFIGNFNYNQTDTFFFYNQTDTIFFYNQTFIGNFNYNETDAGYYENFFLNLSGSNANTHIDIGNFNFTAIIGFFTDLGSSASRIAQGWFTNLNVSNNLEVDENVTAREFKGFGIMPIGSVTAWLGNLSGTPSLPSGWVMLNGQNLTGCSCVYEGIIMPNLNGNNSFLRGNETSSGSEGGKDNVSLTMEEMPKHSHSINDPGHNHAPSDGNRFVTSGSTTTAGSGFITVYRTVVTSTNTKTTGITVNENGSSQAHENNPEYYSVIWIMRVK